MHALPQIHLTRALDNVKLTAFVGAYANQPFGLF